MATSGFPPNYTTTTATTTTTPNSTSTYENTFRPYTTNSTNITESDLITTDGITESIIGTSSYNDSTWSTTTWATTSVTSTIDPLVANITTAILDCAKTRSWGTAGEPLSPAQQQELTNAIVKCALRNTEPFEEIHPLPTWEVIVTVIPLAIIILLVIFGNLMVILAVMTQRTLRTPPNFLIASLALADLTVGVFILPLNVIEMILNGQWIFGEILCRMWLTSDVTLCSTSILHISAIAVDRYRSINEGINYISQRTIRTAVGICVCLWVIALWIASAPVLGWNDWEFKKDHQCFLPLNIGYIFHSASGAFFLPAIVMVTVYVKIFLLIKQRLKDRAKLSSVATEPEPSQEDSSDLTEDDKRKTNKRKYSEQIGEILKSKMRFSLTKERKAAQTLGIIIGSFVICWTPFTLVYITNGILMTQGTSVPLHLFRFVTWLGYVNSALNPIIYTLYNPEFRRAFKRMLRLGDSTSIRKPFTVSTINRA